MIKINLLPPEVLAAKVKQETFTLPWREIGIAAAVLVVGLSVWLPWETGNRARAVKQLSVELQKMEAKKQRLAEMQQIVQHLQRQADALEAAKNRRAQWAPRLSLLSEALVPEVWFTKLEYAQGKSLSVEGTALVDPAGGEKEAGGYIAKFFQQLKEQPGFAGWFSNVELKSVEHRHIKQEEVADFVLLLTPTA